MRTFRHLWPRATAGLAVLIALSLMACVAASEPSHTTTPTTLAEDSHESDLDLIVDNARTGERVPVSDPGELQERLPFSIVVPEHLPPGFRLTGITAFVGGPGIRGESANLFYRRTDGTGSIVLDQSVFEEGMETPRISDPGVEEIAIGDRTGQIHEVDEPDRHFITMVWTGCGVVFGLTAPGQHTRDELVRVAESTLSCQGLG